MLLSADRLRRWLVLLLLRHVVILPGLVQRPAHVIELP